jgi:hypothetical protein
MMPKKSKSEPSENKPKTSIKKTARLKKTTNIEVSKKTVRESYAIPIEPPAGPLKESITLKPEQKPARGRTRKEDPWTELPERTRSYLKLWPYGKNIIIDRNALANLQNFFVKIHELPLPNTLWEELNTFQNQVRSIIELISLEDVEEQRQQTMKEHWQPFNPNYICKCNTRKRRAPSKSTKTSTNENDD